jgi:hypothetical protein
LPKETTLHTRNFESHPKKSQKSQKRRKIIHVSNKMQHTFFFLGCLSQGKFELKKRRKLKKKGKILHVKRNAM